jgi:hypothetical protein
MRLIELVKAGVISLALKVRHTSIGADQTGHAAIGNGPRRTNTAVS